MLLQFNIVILRHLYRTCTYLRQLHAYGGKGYVVLVDALLGDGAPYP